MTDVFTLLKSYDLRCEQMARNLDLPVSAQEEWRGLGFKVSNIEMAIGIDAVVEIIDYCDTRKLPNTVSWFHGVANVRGTLAAISDFREMLFSEPCAMGASTRIILLRTGGTMIGLLVDEVTGIRNSPNGVLDEVIGHLKGDLASFVKGCIRHDRMFLPVLDYERLVSNPLFLSVQSKTN